MAEDYTVALYLGTAEMTPWALALVRHLETAYGLPDHKIELRAKPLAGQPRARAPAAPPVRHGLPDGYRQAARGPERFPRWLGGRDHQRPRVRGGVIMLFFRRNADGTVAVLGDRDPGRHDPGVVSRWHFRSMADAQQMAADAGPGYMATDAGDCVSPRYDVIRVPQVGDDVSYGFNGDYYPCGKIVKVSASLRRIETSTGDTFYRHQQTGRWFMRGTWALVHGTHDERNPHL